MTDSEQSGESTCPVCGQEYVHKRKESKRGSSDTLRPDYSECRRNHPVKAKEYVYVHDTQRTVVSRVERDDADTPSLLDSIRGVGK